MIIYEFGCAKYDRTDVEKYDKAKCESLHQKDDLDVCKFVGDVEDILNDNDLDIDNNWYRTFNN